MVNGSKNRTKGGFFSEGKTVILKDAAIVTIDHPKEKETVNSGHYAIRLSGKSGLKVEVSINNGAWASCRFAAGHYWLDWYPSKSGAYRLLARSHAGDSNWKTSVERSCAVATKGEKVSK